MDSNTRATANRTLLVTSLVGFMVAMEITIISVARDELARAFPSATAATLSWVITGYNLGVASLLLPAGWLADRYGRKRVFLFGLVGFALGSLLSGCAPSAGFLIAARVLQSIGGACQYPAGLALLLSAFPRDRQQAAIGIWGAVAGLAAALAPSLGAVLIQGFGWRAVFLVNVPVAAWAFLAGRVWIQESVGEGVSSRVDLLSVPLASLGVGSLLLAVVQGRDWGWLSPATLVACLIGVVLMLAFVVRSRVHPEPLFDLKLFRLRSYTIANIGSVFFLVAFFSWLIVLPEYLQRVWGWSVLKSGFAIAPGPVLSSVLSVTNGRLAARIGHRPILMAGGLFGVVACLLHLAFTGTTPSYVGGLLFANLVMGAAAGCSFSMLVGACMRDVQPGRLGMAGAGRTTVFQLAIALGVAVAIGVVGRPGGPMEALDNMRTVWWIALIMYACQVALFAVAYPDEMLNAPMREQAPVSPHRLPAVFLVRPLRGDGED
ncbi:MAG: DHA2 family efflux MFS transporter permease subunit [Actinomycetota bacterium]|nr:DHA2 family efflux MFS transporter permease subunit [Actinomycetota bacterium]